MENKNDEREIVQITEDNIDSYADQIRLDTLISSVSVNDLYDTYGIDRKGLLKILGELRRKGNNIRMFSTPNASNLEATDYVKNYGHLKLQTNEEYRILDDDPSIRVMFASDTRFGSKEEQPTIFNEMCATAKKTGVKYIIINGDVVEGMYSGSKDLFNTTLFKEGYDDQSDHVAEMLPRIDGIRYLITTGEHDLSFLRSKAKVDIGKLIAEKREDVTYLGQKTAKVVFTNSQNSNEISIGLRHAIGQVPYTVSYKPQQIIASLRNEDKTDILVNSHYLACDTFLKRGIRQYQTPSVVATTDEMKMFQTPVYNTVGAWIVRMDKDSKGKLKGTSQLLLPYYNTIKDDYKTSKPLRISDTVKVPVSYSTSKKKSESEERKIFSSFKDGDTIEEASEKLGVSTLDFGGLIEELRSKDYDVDILDKEDGTRIISKKTNAKRKRNIKAPMEELEHVKCVFMSDTHLCNENQQLQFVNAVVKEGYENGFRDFYHFGDVVDGDYHNRGDHRYALFRLGATRQAEYTTENWPESKKKDIKLHFITATHDNTHAINGGLDIGKLMQLMRRDDFEYLGSDQAYVPLGKEKKCIMEMYHPGGGCSESYSYKPQKYIDKMDPGNKPNILGEGHYHKSYMQLYRNVISFLIPCLTAKSSFIARQGLENTMGAYYVDMWLNKKGEVEYIEFEEKRFDPSQVKKDEYLKTRKLILG